MKTTALLRRFLAVAGSAVLISPLAHAATIAWGSATWISTTSSTDVSATGTAVYAKYFSNVGGAPSTTVVNGVTFGLQNTPTGDGKIEGYGTQFNVFVGYGSVTDTDYQTILGSSWYDIRTVTLNGLTNGQLYQVQVWAQDPRYNNAQTTTISGGPSLRIDSDAGAAGVGQFVIGTFTADATTQTIGFGVNDAGIVNAISLRAIPEPSAALLGGLPFLLALLRRRREAV